MFSGLKQRFRRRLLGNRNSQRIEDVHRTAGLLGNRYYLERFPQLKAAGFAAPINAYEFSFYSQNGEDGIILHLLDKVGVLNHSIIEIGTEDVRECNSANLIFNFGWSACLIEAEPEWAVKAGEYLASLSAGDRVRFVHARVMPDNINETLKDAGFLGELDILSIDIDSYDYWLWRAVEICSPRIVVIEYNASFGPSLSVTVPSPDQEDISRYINRWYHGASVTAMQRLGERKGYQLVGGDSNGVNIFFVREDLIAAAGLCPVSPANAFRPHQRRSRKASQEEQYQAVTRLPLVTVE